MNLPQPRSPLQPALPRPVVWPVMWSGYAAYLLAAGQRGADSQPDRPGSALTIQPGMAIPAVGRLSVRSSRRRRLSLRARRGRGGAGVCGFFRVGAMRSSTTTPHGRTVAQGQPTVLTMSNNYKGPTGGLRHGGAGAGGAQERAGQDAVPRRLPPSISCRRRALSSTGRRIRATPYAEAGTSEHAPRRPYPYRRG